LILREFFVGNFPAMSDWNTQIRRGTIEMCVMALIAQVPSYGYEILVRLQQEANLECTESTIYPLLARLTKDKLLSVQEETSPSGPPRRYFRLTEAGKKRLTLMVTQWRHVSDSVSRLTKDISDDNCNQ
jgi:PadR family transcriptional regulator PadR